AGRLRRDLRRLARSRRHVEGEFRPGPAGGEAGPPPRGHERCRPVLVPVRGSRIGREANPGGRPTSMRSWLKVIGLAGALVIPGRAGRGEDPRPDVVGPGARGGRVVALGDSITKGVRAGVRPEETFAALAERALKADGIDAEVVNLGMGGERTDQALKRLDAVSGHRPRVVTVMDGTNDSHVDRGATANRISLEDYTANLRAIMAGLLLRGIEPILMTEPRWADDAPVNGLGESPNVRLAPYREACRAVAAECR